MSSNERAVARLGKLAHDLALPIVALSACGHANEVRYVDGHCLIDGEATTLARVEVRQAEMTQHVLSRQPVLTAIAVAAVALAGASYLQRILTVLAARRAPAQSFSDRLRARMERYRAHPVRYFLLLGGVLGVLIVAGVAYVSMDADKRASERSLASLQFCHLALRSAEEQHVLAEQRNNLASIQSTESDIRALVDKLPPAEQQKAHEIVEQLSTSLGQQRTMVAHFAAHADDTARAVTQHQAEVERGLSKLADDVVDLKSMPAAVGKLSSELHDVGTRVDTVGGELEAGNARIETLGKALDAVAKQLDALANRPAPTCPACTCTTASSPPQPQPIAGVAHPSPVTPTPLSPATPSPPATRAPPSGSTPSVAAPVLPPALDAGS
jgi:hypothetical protein